MKIDFQDGNLPQDIFLQGSHNIKDSDCQNGIDAALNHVLHFYVYENGQYVNDDAVGVKEIRHVINVQRVANVLASNPSFTGLDKLWYLPLRELSQLSAFHPLRSSQRREPSEGTPFEEYTTLDRNNHIGYLDKKI